MPSSRRDTSWTVLDPSKAHCFVELDVRVWGDYNTPTDDPHITDVRALFRKHGQLVEVDLPDDLRGWAIRELQNNEELMADWAQQIAEEEEEAR